MLNSRVVQCCLKQVFVTKTCTKKKLLTKSKLYKTEKWVYFHYEVDQSKTAT